ncbi:MAG: hypothetical protein LBT37_07560 [Lactobacillaceae bacterium]|jgi:hypothetical protein|nr:hypothetical protein [Lactobacillaceae bacterium]
MKPNSVNSAKDEYYFSADEIKHISSIYKSALDEAQIINANSFKLYKLLFNISILIFFIILMGQIWIIAPILKVIFSNILVVIGYIHQNPLSELSIKILSVSWIIFLGLSITIFVIMLAFINKRKHTNGPSRFINKSLILKRKQNYRGLRIFQTVKTTDYLILYVKNWKLIEPVSPDNRFLILRKKDDKEKYDELANEISVNLRKKLKGKIWYNVYYIDATKTELES